MNLSRDVDAFPQVAKHVGPLKHSSRHSFYEAAGNTQTYMRTHEHTQDTRTHTHALKQKKMHTQRHTHIHTLTQKETHTRTDKDTHKRAHTQYWNGILMRVSQLYGINTAVALQQQAHQVPVATNASDIAKLVKQEACLLDCCKSFLLLLSWTERISIHAQ